MKLTSVGQACEWRMTIVRCPDYDNVDKKQNNTQELNYPQYPY